MDRNSAATAAALILSRAVETGYPVFFERFQQRETSKVLDSEGWEVHLRLRIRRVQALVRWTLDWRKLVATQWFLVLSSKRLCKRPEADPRRGQLLSVVPLDPPLTWSNVCCTFSFVIWYFVSMLVEDLPKSIGLRWHHSAGWNGDLSWPHPLRTAFFVDHN